VGNDAAQANIVKTSTSATYLNTVKDGGVEHVNTGVDAVTDELDGLLNKAVNDGGSGLGNDDTVSRGLSNLGHLKRN
jgi:hypothetical protein